MGRYREQRQGEPQSGQPEREGERRQETHTQAGRKGMREKQSGSSPGGPASRVTWDEEKTRRGGRGQRAGGRALLDRRSVLQRRTEGSSQPWGNWWARRAPRRPVDVVAGLGRRPRGPVGNKAPSLPVQTAGSLGSPGRVHPQGGGDARETEIVLCAPKGLALGSRLRGAEGERGSWEQRGPSWQPCPALEI